MSGKPKSRAQIVKERTAFAMNVANNSDEARDRRDKQYEELGQLICSLKPEDYGLFNGAEMEDSEEPTSEQIISNVLNFLDMVRRDVGCATEGTILAKTKSLTAKLCDVKKRTVSYIDQKNQRRKARDEAPFEKELVLELSTGETDIITAHEKEILQEQLREMEERRRLARERRHGNAPGDSYFEPSPIVHATNEVLDLPRGKKRRAPEPLTAEQVKLSKEAQVKIVENPFWKKDIGLLRLAKTADRTSKIGIAMAEEAERKRKREEKIRERKEKQWVALGEAICGLELSDFVLPPGTEVGDEVEPEYRPPLNIRGEELVIAVATFVQSLRGLLGDKLTQDTILADQHGLAAAFCSINHSAMTTRFKFKRKKTN